MKKPNHKPFFSIVIPTYNRSKYLQCAIQGIVGQDYVDYELIISDNASSDDTEKMVSQFLSNRVRYFRNTKNVGWIKNLQNAISHSKGKYIIFHGDDDFIYDRQCLRKLYELLLHNPVGLIRLNYLSYSNQFGEVFDFHVPKLTDIHINAKQTGEDVVSFIQKMDPFFVTGIVIRKNTGAVTKDFIDSEYVPWFPMMFNALIKHGGRVCPTYSFVASWSQNSNPRYKMKQGVYSFEKYYYEVKKHVDEKYYKKFLREHIRVLVSEFPAAKYFLSTKEYIAFALHALTLDTSLQISPYFWIYFLGSLVTPKFVLKSLRNYYLHKKCEAKIRGSKHILAHIAIFRKIKDDAV